jgi:hypothetical protein
MMLHLERFAVTEATPSSVCSKHLAEQEFAPVA